MLPPDLMAALGGGAGDPGAGAPTVGPDAGPAPTSDDSSAGGGSTTDILQRMIDDARSYLEVEQDEEDKLTMTKVLSQLQGYLAKEQKEQDDMLQGKASPRALRKATSGPAV
jgi:hypothetical protein